MVLVADLQDLQHFVELNCVFLHKCGNHADFSDLSLGDSIDLDMMITLKQAVDLSLHCFSLEHHALSPRQTDRPPHAMSLHLEPLFCGSSHTTIELLQLYCDMHPCWLPCLDFFCLLTVWGLQPVFRDSLSLLAVVFSRIHPETEALGQLNT